MGEFFDKLEDPELLIGNKKRSDALKLESSVLDKYIGTQRDLVKWDWDVFAQELEIILQIKRY